MEGQITFFVFVMLAAAVMNTVVFFCAYKALAKMEVKTTEAITEFQRSGLTKEWIQSMQIAADQAVKITEATKQKMAELEPVLERTQAKFSMSLVKIDSKLQDAGEEITNGSRKIRDAVAKPAFSFMGFVAGMNRILSDWAAQDD